MSKPFQLRVPDDLEDLIQAWLEKNPDMNKSQLFFSAVRKYVTEPQALQPVVVADDDEALRLADDILIEVFRENSPVRKFQVLTPGGQSQAENREPWERAMGLDSWFRKKSRRIGSAFDALVLEEIRKGQGVIHTGKIHGLLSLNASDVTAAIPGQGLCQVGKRKHA